jgi:hypothetical protein
MPTISFLIFQEKRQNLRVTGRNKIMLEVVAINNKNAITSKTNLGRFTNGRRINYVRLWFPGL